MGEVTGDTEWQSREKCKILTLEHHMAAKRLGFDRLLNPLLAIDNWRTSLLDGSFPATRFLTQSVLPLVEAARLNDEFAVARIVRGKSPLLDPVALKAAPDAGDLLRKAKRAVTALMELWNTGEPSCGQALESINESGLFVIPDILRPVAELRCAQDGAVDGPAETADPINDETKALLDFLDAPFEQVGLYNAYVSGYAPFDTHQGVKGLEFDRVMVILDDAEARGFMFGYEKLLGAKAASATDIKNAREGKDTGIDRTRRLFYVTCSRAEKSLAIVAYSENPSAVKAHVLASGWFADDEIDIRP